MPVVIKTLKVIGFIIFEILAFLGFGYIFSKAMEFGFKQARKSSNETVSEFSGSGEEVMNTMSKMYYTFGYAFLYIIFFPVTFLFNKAKSTVSKPKEEEDKKVDKNDFNSEKTDANHESSDTANNN